MTTTKKFWFYAFALVGATVMLFGSCEKEVEKNVPVLTTTEVIEITQTTATSGGNITDDGGATVTARGVCWSTNQNPTISDSKTEDGTGAGSFVSGISGLEPNTMYYVRAYATHSDGTGYGSALSFTTLEELTGAVDADGNIYSTVIIGNQEWFAENLKTTKLNNGTPIPYIIDNGTWGGLRTPAYCWYNNQTTYGNTYGALYNWYAVNTGNLCPTGWHVPTDAEWTAFTDYVGGATVAGTKLKATSGWNSGGNGTDEYGFSALPGGFRYYYYYGGFFDVGDSGYWWSSTEGLATNAWNRGMFYDDRFVDHFCNDKSRGLSVRCVRD